MVCGVASGACAALLSCPAEVSLVRMCNDVTQPVDRRRNYTGVTNALTRILKEEGVQGFFRGCGPFVSRAMIVGVVQVSTNDQFKAMYRAYGLTNEKMNVFASSMTCGLVYATVTMPLETAKNRMAFQKRDHLQKDFVVKYRSIPRLWKGFSPYYLRCGVHTVVMFNTIEFLRSAYRKEAPKQQCCCAFEGDNSREE
eukprot:gene28784-35705_t